MTKVRLRGVCPKSFSIDMEGDVIKSISYEGGCNGGSSLISRIVEGKEINEVIAGLDGIECGSKGTSCTQELVNYLKEVYSDTRG